MTTEINLDDIKTMIGIIQICLDRNAFQEEELEKVNSLNKKLFEKLKIPKKIQLDKIELDNLEIDNLVFELPINPDVDIIYDRDYFFEDDEEQENLEKLENIPEPIKHPKNINFSLLPTIDEDENEYFVEKLKIQQPILKSVLE